jgi:hypothetical protein
VTALTFNELSVSSFDCLNDDLVDVAEDDEEETDFAFIFNNSSLSF